MKFNFLLILLTGIGFQAFSQAPGRVVIMRDSRIDSLVKKNKIYNENKKSVSGFRVQIYSGIQRAKANEAKALFHEKFPNQGVYLQYQQPNFKVRVGDFKTRIEAYAFMKQIEIDYENVFIVKDEIKP